MAPRRPRVPGGAGIAHHQTMPRNKQEHGNRTLDERSRQSFQNPRAACGRIRIHESRHIETAKIESGQKYEKHRQPAEPYQVTPLFPYETVTPGEGIPQGEFPVGAHHSAPMQPRLIRTDFESCAGSR
jgi:hypothetical protein